MSISVCNTLTSEAMARVEENLKKHDAEDTRGRWRDANSRFSPLKFLSDFFE